MKSHQIGILCISALFSSLASATIISGAVTGGASFDQGGNFVKLAVPLTGSTPVNTVGNDTFQDPNLYGFDEGQNLTTTSTLEVNDLADGLGGGSGPGTIPSGVTLASHYVFFDPEATTTQVGTISFDSDVFGVITSSENLLASDFLIPTGINYLNPGNRGLEAGDNVTITGLQTITVDWLAFSPGDYIRVLTAFSPAGTVVPIPAAVWLFGSSLVGLIGISRRKKTD
jgi:hypothetical protein